MPWCEDCAHYWAPNAMNADGTCPTCGRALAPGGAAAASDGGARTGAGDVGPAGVGGGTGGGGRPEVAGVDGAAGEDASSGGAPVKTKAPWHFKLLIVAVVAYLGWRAWQLLVWLVQHFSGG